MIRRTFLGVAGFSVLVAAAVSGTAGVRAGASMAGRLAGDRTTDGREIAYGSDPLHTLSFWGPARAGARGGPAPLILFVHGGGWKRGDKDNATGKAKVAHFTGEGYALASIDYRLVPEARVEDQAADVARALAWVRAHAGDLGIDPARIILMGHSAGAHLVALVGTDPRYLRATGLDEDSLAGVVAIDGAAYDVPAQLEGGPRLMGPTYEQAFGSDPARQRMLSPTLQAAAPNAPAFLILHVQRSDGIAQAQALAQALHAAGTAVQVESFEGTGLRGHMEINRRLGDPDYPATAVVDAWLRTRLAPARGRASSGG